MKRFLEDERMEREKESVLLSKIANRGSKNIKERERGGVV